jgi:hypothetical protein
MSACGDSSPTPQPTVAEFTPIQATSNLPPSPVVTPNLQIIKGTIEKSGDPTAATTVITTESGTTALIVWDQATRIVTAAGTDATFANLENGMMVEVRGQILNRTGDTLTLLPAQIKIMNLAQAKSDPALQDKSCRNSLLTYFKALNDKDYSLAYGLLSYSLQKQEKNSADFGERQGQTLRSIKEVNILEGPQPGQENSLIYQISLNVEPGSQATNWQSGPNVRWVSLIKENGNWHIAEISTSPITG